MIEIIATSDDEDFMKQLGIVLANHPTLLWYLIHKAPKTRPYYEAITNDAPRVNKDTLKTVENAVIKGLETTFVYVYPQFMDTLTYISGWDPEKLLLLASFEGKRVLDLGSGTGRLAFAAAPHAKAVYACEPGERMRHYMQDKAKKLGYDHVYVVDGTIEAIPFENDVFDIVMAGHVIGDDHESEYNELCRVLKDGGMIIDCPGEDERKRHLDEKMVKLGFNHSHYVSKYGGDVYRYWKIIHK